MKITTISSCCTLSKLESGWVSFSYEIGRLAAKFGRLNSGCVGGKEAAAAEAYFTGNGAVGAGSWGGFTRGRVVPGFGGRGAILGAGFCFGSSFLDIVTVDNINFGLVGDVALIIKVIYKLPLPP